jgi:endonuclease/exonuclease/phosphatase family metal-dependent hydrolase
MYGDPLAVHRVLRAADADLVCLQEAPRLPGIAGRQLAALARAGGLIPVVGGRSAAGNAVFRSGRVRVRDARALTFPKAHWRLERRGAVLVTVGLPAGPGSEPAGPPTGRSGPERLARVGGMHLSLDPAERLDHVRRLIKWLSAAGLPMIVAGDLNERPGGPVWQALASIVSDPASAPGDPGPGPTFPVRGLRARIDAVLTGPGVTTLEYGQWQPDPRDIRLASDHLPVLAQLRF